MSGRLGRAAFAGRDDAAASGLWVQHGPDGRVAADAIGEALEHGLVGSADQVAVVGRDAVEFWLKDQRVIAAMNANVWDVVEPIQTLIRGGLPVDPARLAHPDIPLDQVTGEPAGALAATSTR